MILGAAKIESMRKASQQNKNKQTFHGYQNINKVVTNYH